MLKRISTCLLIMVCFIFGSVIAQNTFETPVVTENNKNIVPNMWAKSTTGAGGFMNKSGNLIQSFVLNKTTGIPMTVWFTTQNRVTDSTSAPIKVLMQGTGIFKRYSYAYIDTVDLTAVQWAVPRDMANRLNVPVMFQEDSVFLVTFTATSHDRNESGYVYWEDVLPIQVDGSGYLITRVRAASEDSLGTFELTAGDTIALKTFDGNYSIRSLALNTTTTSGDSIYYSLAYLYKFNELGWIKPTGGELLFSTEDSTVVNYGVNQISGQSIIAHYADSIAVYVIGLANSRITFNNTSLRLRE